MGSGSRQQRRLAARQASPTAAANAERPALDDEWRRWIAENLLLGASTETVTQRLVARGCPRALAEREIALAMASPYFRGAGVLRDRLEKRDWVLACQARMASFVEDGLHRQPAPSPEHFFRDHYAANRPALLSGLVDEWPALRLWSLDYFAERLGDPLVEVQAGRDGDSDYEARSLHHKRLVRLADLLADLRADPETNDFYVTANNGGHNREVLAALWQDIGPLPGILVPEPGRDGFFWMGPRGTITPWHHDLTSNLLVQVRGRKCVSLVSDSQTPLMRNDRHCFSTFGGNTDFADLPEAERPHMIQCVLEPGDALFIPVGWWHHVEGLDMTISLSFTNFALPNDFGSFYRSYGQV